MNMEMSYHLFYDTENKQIDKLKKQLLVETCHGVPDNAKLLRTKPIEQEQTYFETIKQMYNKQNAASIAQQKRLINRQIPTQPEKILDAPDLRDDYYLNIIDWSLSNHLAVCLGEDLYVWNATTGDINQLFSLESTNEYLTSTSWMPKSNIIAVGNSQSIVELWDVNKQQCLRQMRSHTSRVATLSWNEHILTSGSRTGHIHHHDIRVQHHHVATLKLHEQEVCGLKWNQDGRHLASGGNDNLVAIWDSTMSHEHKPLHVLRDHQAAVKAVSWCPWQSNLLATGGGTADKTIKIWNMYNGNLLQNTEATSQISSILWSKYYRELISSHGWPDNQLTIWKYPEMNKVCDLTGHANRVLAMALSPDEEMVVSVGADETLRFWKCFQLDEKLKKTKELLTSDSRSGSYTSLSRCIR